MEQRSDTDLVKAARQGDRSAYAQLIHAHYQAVFLVCLGMLGNVHDAEDLAQDTMITGFERIRQLREPSQFRPWLMRIAQNVSINFVRHRALAAHAMEQRSAVVPQPKLPRDDVWVNGDYHLKSRAGHWDRDTRSWVLDDLTSPCIDAGDPNAPLGNEPFPNGGFVNIGAYAGTSAASRSYFGGPVCANQLAGDINGDCKVDDLDVDILMSHWLMDATLLENTPPSITLLSPTEGAEFTAGMSMVLRAEASDADGRVIRVEYTLRSQSENGSSVTGTGTADPTNNWEVTWDGWTRVMIAPGWTYTIQAEALDDQGAKTLTPEVEIELNP